MSTSKKERSFGRPDWPLWKILVTAPLIYLPFSFFLLIIPPFLSSDAFKIGTILVFLGSGSLIWGHFTRRRLPEILGSLVFTVQFLAIAARSFMVALPMKTTWLLPLYVAFLLAWLVPHASKQISSQVWRSLIAPQTKLGRFTMTLILVIISSAGLIGASFGMYGSRFGDTSTVWLVGAIVGSFVAIGWGFSASYDLAMKYQN